MKPLARCRRAVRLVPLALPIIGAAVVASSPSLVRADPSKAVDSTGGCAGDNGGLSLPRGFCATVFADNIGHARHLVVVPNGTVYVNTWSGRYYHDQTPAGGLIVALRDTKGDGRADVLARFGETIETGGSGGTGIALYKGALYAEEGERILRYALSPGEIAPKGAPEVVVSGLPVTGDHPMHPFAIDAEGRLYMDSGSATNSCQVKNRTLESPGHDPCTELETRGGIWLYDANKTGQKFSPAERFATGDRNGEGIAIDSTGIFVTQHGRDQLAENWPRLYTPEQGANQPAEEVVKLEKGADYGWPECYYDGVQQKLVLAPEYGGDGGKKVGICARKQAPVAAYPAHWAPNDMVVYRGAQFPTAYGGGAFIAFHGSWNRAPFPQGGYNVVFQPLADGKPSGQFVVFADGFAGAVKEPGRAAHRPSGVAVGPDGTLYISDDVHGRIWRVTFTGDIAATGVEEAAPRPAEAKAATQAGDAVPPEGIDTAAGRHEPGTLPVPPGATAEQVALGDRIFHGQVADGTCAGCHGSNGKGSPVGPDLTTGKWLWSDGSLAAITDTIRKGVPQPKEYGSPMPPLGGSRLSESEVADVAAYVWALGHGKGR